MPSSTSPAGVVVSSPFIRDLASSNGPTRTKALDSLRLYLTNRITLTPLDLLKLWKGFFYCVWMTDKPRYQQQLARDLASLVTAGTLAPTVALPFLDAFWQTMASEWSGIDSLRMDKFLYLVRVMLGAQFKHLATSQPAFAQTKLELHNEILSRIPLSVSDHKIPNGMRYHVLDVFVDELEKSRDFPGRDMDLTALDILLIPVQSIRKNSPDKPLRKRAKETLLDERITEWTGQSVVTDDEKSEAEEQDEEEWLGFGD